jgi:hypothetical protein
LNRNLATAVRLQWCFKWPLVLDRPARRRPRRRPLRLRLCPARRPTEASAEVSLPSAVTHLHSIGVDPSSIKSPAPPHSTSIKVQQSLHLAPNVLNEQRPKNAACSPVSPSTVICRPCCCNYFPSNIPEPLFTLFIYRAWSPSASRPCCLTSNLHLHVTTHKQDVPNHDVAPLQPSCSNVNQTNLHPCLRLQPDVLLFMSNVQSRTDRIKPDTFPSALKAPLCYLTL